MSRAQRDSVRPQPPSRAPSLAPLGSVGAGQELLKLLAAFTYDASLMNLDWG